MPSNRVVKVRSTGDSVTAQEMRDGIVAIQQELKVSASFPDSVEQAAAEAAQHPRLPELDRTDIELVTIDPEGAKDLDQAMHIERHGDGYVVHYAIADVAAFVTPGDPVDVEANRRGETLYGADSKIPLHPPVLSEGAASLLPDQVRPALLWTIQVDEVGEGIDVQVERALVKSRAQLSYEAVQADLDAGRAGEHDRAAQGGRRAAPGPRGRARGRLAAPARAGARRDRRRPLGAGVPAADARGELERPDLPAHRHGRGVADGLCPRRHPAHAAAGRPARRAATAPHGAGAGHRVAGRAALPRLHPHARPLEADARRDGRGVHAAAARRRLRDLQRRAARAGAALGARLGVRPRDRAAASPRRPLRRRDLRGAVRRAPRCPTGCSPRWPSCPRR